MSPLSSFQGSVADLFATLGLDSSGFDQGLRDAQVKLTASAEGMKGPVLSLYSLLKQLESQISPRAALAAFDQLNVKLGDSRANLMRWQREVMPALLEAQVALNKTNASLAGTPVVGGGVGGEGFGSASLITHITERFLIYQGLRFAVKGVTDALHEADDITRRMDQTGWGSKGIQQLQLEAERLHAPVDQATAAITRFEEKIDSGDISAVKALDNLRLKFTSVRAQMAENPQAAFETVIARMAAESNQGALADEAFGLFQDRSGKMLAFIKEYARLKADAEKQPLLSDEDKTAVENLNAFLARLGQRFSVGVGRVIGSFSQERSEDFQQQLRTGGLAGPNRRIGNIDLPPSPTLPALGDTGTGSSVADLRRLLDQFRGPYELASRKLQEDMQTMLLLERQGIATHAQVIEFQHRASMKLQEEAQAQIDATIRSDTALLNEFGAQGKRTTELMTADFKKLSQAFNEGRISIQELAEATTNYFSMLEDNAARPALREAIKMFEQGMIGPDELLKARLRARSLDARTQAEGQFERGEISPADLMRAQGRYRQTLSDFGRDMGSDFYRGPQGTMLRVPRRSQLPMGPYGDPNVGGQGTTINVVPMDQFSEQVLRRWKQQGLMTP